MITRQIYDSIFVAVCDGSQREWTDEQKTVVLSHPELMNQLQGWFENSLSDGCWHDANYDLVNSLSPSSLRDEEEKTYIPF
ncbi:hypothetical protein [Anabaena azotica]|uniref:Uncharacterized protein n=1 Tax=Anabaena azotica FACHB-119 TaxID=947527 RepID=A0ABR8DD72_9NOST|nr:hypothetical protein [Anabaena azotica]MBD2504589.1 hypothetical protein [Anabaena azotica FACHB-119]